MKERGKVLVIEDEQEWQNDLREYLAEAGYHVEICDNLETALQKVIKEQFHFITLDMRLSKEMDPSKFEGWSILEIVKKLRTQDITPVMVITGHETDYERLKNKKEVESLFLMGKGEFNREEFIAIINREVDRRNLKFNNDHRQN